MRRRVRAWKLRTQRLEILRIYRLCLVPIKCKGKKIVRKSERKEKKMKEIAVIPNDGIWFSINPFDV